MTVEQGFRRIEELYDIEALLDELLGQFKNVCQDSPLTSAEEDSYIEMYKALKGEIETIHAHVVDSYLAWIIEARAT